jgi:hypothetical protein
MSDAITLLSSHGHVIVLLYALSCCSDITHISLIGNTLHAVYWNDYNTYYIEIYNKYMATLATYGLHSMLDML